MVYIFTFFFQLNPQNNLVECLDCGYTLYLAADDKCYTIKLLVQQ